VFTLFGVVFFFIGLALFGIGLLGEYVGRIYAQVRERPRYIIEGVLEADTENERDDPGPVSTACEVARADQAIPR
jgi:undecaprenyl-phosphate 4-deoxy-4-formamido-L-arabinose transferase